MVLLENAKIFSALASCASAFLECVTQYGSYPLAATTSCYRHLGEEDIHPLSPHKGGATAGPIAAPPLSLASSDLPLPKRTHRQCDETCCRVAPHQVLLLLGSGAGGKPLPLPLDVPYGTFVIPTPKVMACCWRWAS